jgi:hypothetical protein
VARVSYDISLSPYRMGDTTVRPVLDWNYTYNIRPMTEKAGLRSLTDLHNLLASEALPIIASVIEAMEADPEDFRALNPANGWGDYDTLLERLHDLRDELATHPAAIVSVW